ncbi:twin-arginine translocation signal domain-containing protein [Thermogemmatispora sp.]|uniref:twin-arginine translocation signal domain-containing protein n=1 Tax=Thermogemmatispora sp. TaxID=1968838 RepID=UPI001DD9771C|nr:twin-arginine translocation signal domain-containing protein [Thermogemmatispora sp.]MBX5452224.1 twin-arginine translocation signal domain-containing protein [Thermogemmatispora sp.]
MRPEYSRQQPLFTDILGQQSRRHFLRRAGIAGLSASALATMLEACGGSNPSTSTTTTGIDMAGPIKLETLIANAKKEGQLQAVGIPPESTAPGSNRWLARSLVGPGFGAG